MAYKKQNFTDGQVLIAEHLNRIEDGIVAAEQTGGDAVLYTPQDLSQEEQAQARENIGAVAPTEVTSLIDQKLFDVINRVGSAILHTSQDLSQEEQAQARENIGAVTSAEVAAIVEAKISGITNAEEVAY